MVNLLGAKEQRELRVRYYTGLLSAAVFVLVAVCIVGIAFLTPSYFLAESEAKAAVRALDASAESVKLYQSSGIVRQVSLLKERLALLKEYERSQTTALVLSNLTTGVSDDIQIRSISLAFTGSKTGDITVSGKAKTRVALVNFGKKLEDGSLFSGAVVPISDLVNGTDLDFSIPFTFDANAL